MLCTLKDHVALTSRFWLRTCSTITQSFSIQEVLGYGISKLQQPHYIANVNTKQEELITNASYESEILLLDILDVDNSYDLHFLNTTNKQLVTHEQFNLFKSYIERRRYYEPISYIINKQDFYGRDYFVTNANYNPSLLTSKIKFQKSKLESVKSQPLMSQSLNYYSPLVGNVLIPRPSSEVIVDVCLNWMKEPKNKDYYYNNSETSNRRLLELGSGSGCITLSVLLELNNDPTINRKCKLLATGIDISDDAINISQKNAAKYKVTECKFINMEWKGASKRVELQQQQEEVAEVVTPAHDVIISNPPYVPPFPLSPSVALYEPTIALDGGKEGIDPYRVICKEIPFLLRPSPHSALIFEIGIHQQYRVQEIVENSTDLKLVETFNDLQQIPRVMLFAYPN